MKRRDRELVRRYVDGELDPAEVHALHARAAGDPDLRAYLAEMGAVVREVRALRDAPMARPPLRLPASVPARPASAWRHPGWLAAAAAGLALWIGVDLGLAPDDAAGVEFRLQAPNARRVEVAGDFNGWARGAVLLDDDDGDGVWTARVRVPPGRHAYMFVVDDRWTTDPAARVLRDDGFGQKNAILEL